MCYRGLRPPSNSCRHELILLAVAGEIAAAKLDSRIDAEHIVGTDIDRFGDVVAPTTITVLPNRIAAGAVLENIAIDYGLISRIAANLDRQAFCVQDRVVFNDDSFACCSAFPVVAVNAIPMIISAAIVGTAYVGPRVPVTVHIDLVRLRTVEPPTRHSPIPGIGAVQPPTGED